MFKYLQDTEIPEYYKNLTGLTCKYCGSPIIVNDNCSVVKCPNPYCRRKIAGSINKITTNCGIKGIGKSSCLNLITIHGYTTVSDFLMFLPASLAQPIIERIDQIFTLDEAALFMSLPGVQSNMADFLKQFATIKQMNEYFDTLDNGVWTALRKFFPTDTMYANMVDVYFDYFYEIQNLDSIFNLQEKLEASSVKEFTTYEICISDPVNSGLFRDLYGTNPSKAQFITVLNEIFNPYGIRIKFKDNLSSSVFAVLNDSGVATSKVIKARDRGILTTSDDFIRTMLSIAKGANKNG